MVQPLDSIAFSSCTAANRRTPAGEPVGIIPNPNRRNNPFGSGSPPGRPGLPGRYRNGLPHPRPPHPVRIIHDPEANGTIPSYPSVGCPRPIGRHRETGRIEERRGGVPARPFERCCTAADVRRLAAVHAAVHVVIEEASSLASSLTIASGRRPMAPKAASIRSSRERCCTSSTRSTCGRCQPRRRASSALPMPAGPVMPPRARNGAQQVP